VDVDHRPAGHAEGGDNPVGLLRVLHQWASAAERGAEGLEPETAGKRNTML
jgi:hypothetical protein